MITKADIQKFQREKKEAEIKQAQLEALKNMGGREIRPGDLKDVRTSNF